MSNLKQYKLTADGEALLAAAKNKDLPQKGIINHKTGRINLQTITDEQAKALCESKSQYVEPASQTANKS